MSKLTIKDVKLKGKRLLMRVDFNVPLDEHQKITDDKRIKESLPTIQYAVKEGAKVILMSHLGRPDGKRVPEMSLKPAAVRLGELLGKEVGFAEDCIGPAVERRVCELGNGDVLLLENLRFHPEEEENDPGFSKKLANLGDIYASDAFGSAHRAHASTAGTAVFFEIRVSGMLMEKELKFLGEAVGSPRRPFIAILGGAKISDKIPVIENLMRIVDRLIIGGGMAYTFLNAQGKEIGDSMFDKESVGFVKKLLEESPEKFVLPVDCVISDRFDPKMKQVGQVKTVSVDRIPKGWKGLDIGPETVRQFSQILKSAKTILWNGPMGVFEIEATSKGTFELARKLAELTEGGATTVIGGGDSASAVKKAGVAARMTHVSTGGGASLEFLEGKELPGVSVLSEA